MGAGGQRRGVRPAVRRGAARAEALRGGRGLGRGERRHTQRGVWVYECWVGLAVAVDGAQREARGRWSEVLARVKREGQSAVGLSMPVSYVQTGEQTFVLKPYLRKIYITLGCTSRGSMTLITSRVSGTGRSSA